MKLYMTLVFVICGSLAGLAGVVQTARLTIGQRKTEIANSRRQLYRRLQHRHVLMRVAAGILEFRSELVGLSMVFTARAAEFLALAERLRAQGYGGHVTAGGHFATFHAGEILRDCSALDSIVHGEGEEVMGVRA